MNREMLDLLKARTAKEGLPIFINQNVVIKALGTTENITMIPMTLEQFGELMVAEGGLSIDCTDKEIHDIMYGYCEFMAKKHDVRFERCNFNDPRSGARLHSGVYVTVLDDELELDAKFDSVVSFWYMTTKADLIR